MNQKKWAEILLAIILFLNISPASAETQLPSNLVITSPSVGAIVHPGEQINVSVKGINGFSPTFIMVAGPENLLARASVPSILITIPNTIAGSYTFGVLATDESRNSGFSQITVQVSPVAALKTINAMPPGIAIGTGRSPTDQISVSGIYDDGITRDISSDSTGTIYQSSDTGVATVNSQGLVAAQNIGKAIITVTNAGKSFTLPVTVTTLPKMSTTLTPHEISVAVGQTATAYTSITNDNEATAVGCTVSPLGSLQDNLAFQAIDTKTKQPINKINTAFDIPAHRTQVAALTFAPKNAYNPSESALDVKCSNTAAADTISGVNTLVISASPPERK